MLLISSKQTFVSAEVTFPCSSEKHMQEYSRGALAGKQHCWHPITAEEWTGRTAQIRKDQTYDQDKESISHPPTITYLRTTVYKPALWTSPLVICIKFRAHAFNSSLIQSSQTGCSLNMDEHKSAERCSSVPSNGEQCCHQHSPRSFIYKHAAFMLPTSRGLSSQKRSLPA